MVGMIPFEKRRATRLYKQTRLGTYDNAKSILLLGSHETFANLVIRCAKEKINFCLVEFELPPVKRRNTFTLFRDSYNKDHNMMPERRLAQLAVRRVPHTFLTNPLEMIDFLIKYSILQIKLPNLKLPLSKLSEHILIQNSVIFHKLISHLK